MAVRISALESGRFLIQWDSLKDKNPSCNAYQIYIKTSEGDFPLLETPVYDRGEKKFQALVWVSDQFLSPFRFLKRFPSG